MRKLIVTILFCYSILSVAFSQSVGIGTATPNASAQLDVSSSSKGILIPRMTTGQRDGIANPANGLMIYNYKVSPTTLPEIKSSSTEPATKFYLYKKE